MDCVKASMRVHYSSLNVMSQHRSRNLLVQENVEQCQKCSFVKVRVFEGEELSILFDYYLLGIQGMEVVCLQPAVDKWRSLASIQTYNLHDICGKHWGAVEDL